MLEVVDSFLNGTVVGAPCGMGSATALPHGKVTTAKQAHPYSPSEIYIIIFGNEMGLKLENPS